MATRHFLYNIPALVPERLQEYYLDVQFKKTTFDTIK
jgi:hypothetical protein